MAPHGKQMTPEEKQIIVVLSQQGYSSYKIAEMTGKNRRTISKFLTPPNYSRRNFGHKVAV
jgi:IS30 family transposase